ncbi:MAG: SPOR domain-containing protein, partial [Candidatus Devosia euplotis]|nr:SPOR domain-containing protein [Candidatus Devosia euplotis]
ILPVDRPNIPAVPSTETTIPELLANANTEAVEPAPAPVTAVPVQPGSTVPAVDLAGNLIAGKTAVVPLTRPAGLKLSAATPPAVEIPTAPAEAPSVAVLGAIEVPALGDTAPAYVQLASQRSEAEARQSAQNMVTRYGPLFGGANLEVQRVDLGVKGIYYRVRVPANSLEQANLICTNVKAAGGDCFTL